MADHAAGATPVRQLTLLTARYRPERYGGVEERLWRVTKEMSRRGWRVDVLTENRLKAPEVEEILPGITVHRFAPFVPGRLWRWFYVAYVVWWYRALRARRPDGVVWASDPMTAVAAILAGHRRRLVYNPAACASGMTFIGRLYDSTASLRAPRALEWLDWIGYRMARVVVVSSRNVQRQFTRFYGARRDLALCPYASNRTGPITTRADARATLGLSEHGFVVGFTGRLDPCKGVEFLFAAVRDANFGPADRLLMIGDGPDRERLRALAASEGIEQSVQWTGHVNEPTQYYPALDVLVLPSVYEAFGLVLIEAMSAGVPAIGRASSETVFAATEEVVEDGVTGLITRSNDPAELAAQLTHLRAHPEERVRMGRAAQDAVLRRTWTDVVDDYERLLARVD